MPSTISDAQLIARVVVTDDRHAFGELVRRHQSAVRATLRKLTSGNAALADDLAQETFLLAYRNLKSFRQEAKFSTWLYRIAYNVFLGDARKTKESQLPEDMNIDEISLAASEDATGATRQSALKIAGPDPLVPRFAQRTRSNSRECSRQHRPGKDLQTSIPGPGHHKCRWRLLA